MNLTYEYDHKHTDNFSVELFKEFQSNIEDIMNNVYNDPIEFKLNPYKYLNFLGNGANNYIFKINENYVLRFTSPSAICDWSNLLSIEENKSLIERELSGLNLQKKLSICNNIANIYSYGIVKISQNDTSTIILYSIMDYLKGSFLNYPKNNYNPQDVKLIMKILMKTFIFLDNEGYCYCDIHPYNIMLKDINDISTLQLIDFAGIYSLSNEKKKYNYSNTIDLWCLGILCCSLLIGKSIRAHLGSFQSMPMISINIKDENLENNKTPFMFNIQTEIIYYKSSTEDVTKYYNKISNIYFKIIRTYPEFTDLLNELLGIKKHHDIISTKETNELVRPKEKYEKILTLPIFKNNLKMPIFKNNHKNRWKMW